MSAKILVVDDESKIVKLVRAYLEQAGYSVVVAEDGQTALIQARREKPDLVVLDLGLPGIDGLDVTRTLRREGNTPIIMLTARVDDTDRIIGLELGADDYVTKPFNPASWWRTCARSCAAPPAPRPRPRSCGRARSCSMSAVTRSRWQTVQTVSRSISRPPSSTCCWC